MINEYDFAVMLLYLSNKKEWKHAEKEKKRECMSARASIFSEVNLLDQPDQPSEAALRKRFPQKRHKL